MTISEQIIQEPIKIIENEPTKMTEEELATYAALHEQRIEKFNADMKNNLKNGTDNSTEQSA